PVLELDAHGVQFLPHALLADRLARHDERTSDVAILDEAFAVFEPEMVGELERIGPARIGNRNNDVYILCRGNSGDLPRELAAHAQPGFVHRGAVHHRIGTGEINELEDARRKTRLVRAMARMGGARVIETDLRGV